MITIFIKVIITVLLAIHINAIASGIIFSYNVKITAEEKLPPFWVLISFLFGFVGAFAHFPGFKFTWEGINLAVRKNKKNFEKPLDN
jgi:hypothetical protein